MLAMMNRDEDAGKQFQFVIDNFGSDPHVRDSGTIRLSLYFLIRPFSIKIESPCSDKDTPIQNYSKLRSFWI